MNIRTRILKYIDYKGITKYKFCKDLGLSNGFLDKDGTIGADKCEKISYQYPDINIEWLITGNGNMLKGYDTSKSIYELKEPPAEYGIKKSKEIALYDVSASAGFGSFDEMIAQNKVIGKYVIPDFSNIDWMIYVKGSSMYPKYSSGDIIACRVLNESKFIQWGKVYVVATQEQGLLVKRLDEDGDDSIIAISDNSAYKPFKIPKNEIVGIALVVGVIRLE
jgi:phage repressor protein C with HTH and peptisase S24 domain